MRIHRVSMRNFRGVTSCDVALAAVGVTIVEGDNETGKTSLAQAIDLIFEYPDSSKAGPVQDAQPVGADVGPEVEIEMTVGEARFTYAKRWLRRTSTTLTIHAPRREQLTGREAHDRVEQILSSHADMALWKALRLDQGVALGQASLGESRSLMRALDAASGATAAADEAAHLMQRVEEEFGRYFTPGGQLNKSMKAAVEAAAEAERRVGEIEVEIASLEGDIARHERLVQAMEKVGPRRAEQSKLVAELQAAESEIEALNTAVERAGDRLKVAQLEAAEAEKAVATRSELIEQEREQAETCERLADALREAEAAIGESEQARAAMREDVTAARRALAAAEAGFETASADHEHQRTRMARDLMRTRHEAVVGALERRRESRAFLESCRLDDALLAEIEAADRAVAEASAVLNANRTAVRLESLAEQDLAFDGVPVHLAAGDVVDKPVSGALDIAVPDRLLLRVTAGADTQEEAERAAAARETLARLLRRADVEDLTSARALLHRRQSMAQTSAEADQVLATNLRDLTPEEMVAHLEKFDLEIAAYVTQRVPAPPMPAHLASAAAASQSATEAVAAARTRLVEAEAALELARAGQTEAGKALAGRQALADKATAERDAFLQQLAAARTAKPDDGLDADLAARASAVRMATATFETAAEKLRARDPETLRASLASAQSALERSERQAADDAAELQRLQGRLDTIGERGLHDRLGEAMTEAERATRHLEALERRARAVRALRDTLRRHREEARRRYRAPLKEKIEKFGRIVFGDDLSVELDAELRIVERTLGGVTVPFGLLSTGAREQLGVIERLASATLVSGEGGAPVVFDDALGYSDPDRLRRLGAVLGIAGRDCQVLLLTCMPDRYSHVGEATVVRLERS